MYRVYLASLVTGQSYEESKGRFEKMKYQVEKDGRAIALHPLTAKGYLRTETSLAPAGYKFPPSTDQAIVRRDLWMVEQADIVLVNLLGAKTASIGCTAEMAWAYLLRKHVILMVEAGGNPHNHAFVYQMASVVYTNEAEAYEYLDSLLAGRF
jgi:nucleoside 2-deoxyribosyltransferase